MSSWVAEKRKNEDSRRPVLPVWAWTLIIGFVLGMIFALTVLVPNRVETAIAPVENRVISNASDEAIYATATYIIEQATQQAVEAAQP